jgi:hemoglobin
MSEEVRPTTPYELLGESEGVQALVEAFYDHMEQQEPALAATHRLQEGRIPPELRRRFASFLDYWLGGPQDYLREAGHPRLRMRHGHVPIDIAMRDAWLRSMGAAMDQRGIQGSLRAWLDQRFAETADFMRNRPG